MRGSLIGTLAACFAVAVFMGPKPALSMPANATLSDGNLSAGVVHDDDEPVGAGFRAPDFARPAQQLAYVRRGRSGSS